MQDTFQGETDYWYEDRLLEFETGLNNVLRAYNMNIDFTTNFTISWVSSAFNDRIDCMFDKEPKGMFKNKEH